MILYGPCQGRWNFAEAPTRRLGRNKYGPPHGLCDRSIVSAVGLPHNYTDELRRTLSTFTGIDHTVAAVFTFPWVQKAPSDLSADISLPNVSTAGGNPVEVYTDERCAGIQAGNNFFHRFVLFLSSAIARFLIVRLFRWANPFPYGLYGIVRVFWIPNSRLTSSRSPLSNGSRETGLIH